VKCPTCELGKVPLERTTRPYDVSLPDIVVDGLEQGSCPNCGEFILGVPRSQELDKLILRTLLDKTSSLSGNEVRFLRRSLGLKAIELGSALAVNEQQVSRWETGKRPMPAAADRLLRLLIAVEYNLRAPDLTTIAHTSTPTPTTLHLELGRRGWKARANDRAAKAA
jgi:putative zinc finger/helix-turn-helix YgiT family protein